MYPHRCRYRSVVVLVSGAQRPRQHIAPSAVAVSQAPAEDMPEAAVTKCVETPEQEYAVHRRFIDKALAMRAGHVSLIWHPWSLHRFDPEMKMLELMFQDVQERGLPASTFARYVETLSSTGAPGP